MLITTGGMPQQLPSEIHGAIVRCLQRNDLGALGLACKALAYSIRLTVDSLQIKEVEGWNLIRFPNVKRTPMELLEALRLPSLCSGLRELVVDFSGNNRDDTGVLCAAARGHGSGCAAARHNLGVMVAAAALVHPHTNQPCVSHTCCTSGAGRAPLDAALAARLPGLKALEVFVAQHWEPGPPLPLIGALAANDTLQCLSLRLSSSANLALQDCLREAPHAWQRLKVNPFCLASYRARTSCCCMQAIRLHGAMRDSSGGLEALPPFVTMRGVGMLLPFVYSGPKNCS